MKSRQKRLLLVILAIVGVGLASVLVTNALRSNMAYFFTPTQILAGEAPEGQLMRIGGMVKEGTLKRVADGLTVEFIVTDTASDVIVQYTGILPDLFREGQGVVARGKVNQQRLFVAEEVLAKHDESYMPPEAMEALKAAESMKK
jgi:cytochrome c-type biogenesis protein CcmE